MHGVVEHLCTTPEFLYPVSKLVVCTSPTKRPEQFDSVTGYQF